MRNFVFNFTLFAAVVAVTFFVFTSANAQSTLAGKKWIQCANSTVEKYAATIKQDPLVFQKDFCNFIGASVGQDCDSKVQMLQMTNELARYVNAFTVKRIIQPACGQYPGE